MAVTQALGMIETKGLVASIEAAEQWLKQQTLLLLEKSM